MAYSNKSSGTFWRTQYKGKSVLIGNAHVCQDSQLMIVKSSPQRVIKIDHQKDLCMLEDITQKQGLILAPYHPIEGQNISIIGFPGSSGLKTLTQGLWTGTFKWGEYTTVPVFPGNSGSPVVDDLGLVIGVMNRYNKETRDAVVISIDTVRSFLEL